VREKRPLWQQERYCKEKRVATRGVPQKKGEIAEIERRGRPGGKVLSSRIPQKPWKITKVRAGRTIIKVGGVLSRAPEKNLGGASMRSRTKGYPIGRPNWKKKGIVGLGESLIIFPSGDRRGGGR